MVGLMGWGVSDEQGWRKGPWTPEEDKLLSEYIGLQGDGRWSSVAKFAGLNRSGKSCRLRWVNYLRPGLKKGHLTPLEEGIIIELHALWGNKWATIARYLPGRTDNEIKNYWRTHFKKKAKPSQRQERQKMEAFRHKIYQQQEEHYMNKSASTGEAEKNNEKLVAEPQGNQEMSFMYPTTETQSNLAANNYYQDVASCSDSISDDDLWGSLWSLDELVMSSSSMNFIIGKVQHANMKHIFQRAP